MKSSKMKFRLAVIGAAILLAGCMSNYYDRFGGYPLESDQYIFKQNGQEFRLLVTYRFPYQNGVYDSTSLNISVKIALEKAALRYLQFDKLTLVSADSTYLYSFRNPAVYDKYGKYPLQSFEGKDGSDGIQTASDELCLFTVSRAEPDYVLFLNYRILNSGKTVQLLEKSLPLNIADVKNKARKQPVIYED